MRPNKKPPSQQKRKIGSAPAEAELYSLFIISFKPIYISLVRLVSYAPGVVRHARAVWHAPPPLRSEFGPISCRALSRPVESPRMAMASLALEWARKSFLTF